MQPALQIRLQTSEPGVIKSVSLIDGGHGVVSWADTHAKAPNDAVVKMESVGNIISINIKPATASSYRVELGADYEASYRIEVTHTTKNGRVESLPQRQGKLSPAYVASHVIDLNTSVGLHGVSALRRQLLSLQTVVNASDCSGKLTAMLQAVGGPQVNFSMQLLDPTGTQVGQNPWLLTSAVADTHKLELKSDSDRIIVRVGAKAPGKYSLVLDYKDCKRQSSNRVPDVSLGEGEVHSYLIAPHRGQANLAVSVPKVHRLQLRPFPHMPDPSADITRQSIAKGITLGLLHEDVLQAIRPGSLLMATGAGKFYLQVLPGNGPAMDVEFNRSRISMSEFLATWVTRIAFVEDTLLRHGEVLDVFLPQTSGNRAGLMGVCAYVALLPQALQIDTGYFREVLSNPEQIRGPFCMLDLGPTQRTPTVVAVTPEAMAVNPALTERVYSVMNSIQSAP